MRYLPRFLTLYLLLALSPAALAAQQDWVFVWVNSVPNTYYVKQGTAKVTIEKGRLKAELTSTDGVEYKIAGSISGQRVKVEFAILDSDYLHNSSFSGSYVKKLWPGFGNSRGRESITLTDGWNFIGLNRDIKP